MGLQKINLTQIDTIPPSGTTINLGSTELPLGEVYANGFVGDGSQLTNLPFPLVTNGSSGTSGTSGTSGIDGSSGSSGTSGSSGSSGTSGSSGSSGTSGSSGSSGSTGTSGSSGSSGTSGSSGSTGTSGSSGSSGSSGTGFSTVANYGANRVLISDGTANGATAYGNFTFDGTNLGVGITGSIGSKLDVKSSYTGTDDLAFRVQDSNGLDMFHVNSMGGVGGYGQI